MSDIKPFAAMLAVAVACLAGPVRAGTAEEVRSTFEQFVQAQNSHDAKAVEALLLDSGQFLWITRGMLVWGREAAMQRFGQLYQGSWRLDPEWQQLRVVAVGTEVAHLMVPVAFTTGAAGAPPTVARMFLNQVLLKTPAGWKVTSILPVPAPAP